jgi:hypothetical protein
VYGACQVVPAPVAVKVEGKQSQWGQALLVQAKWLLAHQVEQDPILSILKELWYQAVPI